MKKGYYAADCFNGIYYTGNIADSDQEIMEASEFKEYLDTLNEDKIIVAFFDESNFEILKEIENEYGINKSIPY